MAGSTWQNLQSDTRQPVAALEHPVGQFFHAVDQEVRLGVGEGLRLEAVGNPAGLDAGVAGGEDVDRAIAYHHGAITGGAELLHQALDADGVGLFVIETVAAIHLAEETADAEAVDY